MSNQKAIGRLEEFLDEGRLTNEYNFSKITEVIELLQEEESSKSALTFDSENDYILNNEHDYVWITVKNISIYLKRTDEGVVIDLFPILREGEDCIATTFAFFAEAEGI